VVADAANRPVSTCLVRWIFYLRDLANLVLYAIVGEVNRKLPEDRQFKYLFWYPGKVSLLKKEYRRLYPEGNLASLFNACAGLSAFLMLAFAWQFGFFK
jgi:hypothetical protein